MNNTVQSKSRFDVVDALRGFAVLAILLVHSQEHFMYFVYPDSSTLPEWLNTLNGMVHDTVFAMFAGKSYAIFAFLFGLTFFIQQRSQEKEGRDFGFRFLWRLAWLVVFACINASIFPGGDVLLLYAIMGVVLFVVRKWDMKSITILSVIMLLQPMEWAMYFIGASKADQLNGPLYGEIFKYSTEGNFLDFIKGNLTIGQKASFMWAVENGRMFQTGGLFLLGYMAGKLNRFAENDLNKNFWLKVLMISAFIYVPIATIQGLTKDSYAGSVFDMWQKLAFTFVIVPSFILSYWRFTQFRTMCSSLRTYGRMSLTNYLSQSLLGMLIFMPYGLNLAPKAGMALSLILAMGIFAIQILFSNYWFKRNTKGPLEMLWHKITWINSSKTTVKSAV